MASYRKDFRWPNKKTKAFLPRGFQCHHVPAQNGMPVAYAAHRLSEMGVGLLLLQSMERGYRIQTITKTLGGRKNFLVARKLQTISERL